MLAMQAVPAPRIHTFPLVVTMNSSEELRHMLSWVIEEIDSNTYGGGISLATYNKARALLARTEAGADGVSIWRYRFRNSETGGWHEWRYSEQEPVLNSFVADKTEIQGPFTHPQDASGDAGFSAAELESLAKCVLASVTPGGFHIPEGWNVLLDKLTAMQAKEAK
jgi:hypothetical protein